MSQHPFPQASQTERRRSAAAFTAFATGAAALGLFLVGPVAPVEAATLTVEDWTGDYDRSDEGWTCDVETTTVIDVEYRRGTPDKEAQTCHPLLKNNSDRPGDLTFGSTWFPGSDDFSNEGWQANPSQNCWNGEGTWGKNWDGADLWQQAKNNDNGAYFLVLTTITPGTPEVQEVSHLEEVYTCSLEALTPECGDEGYGYPAELEGEEWWYDGPTQQCFPAEEITTTECDLTAEEVAAGWTNEGGVCVPPIDEGQQCVPAEGEDDDCEPIIPEESCEFDETLPADSADCRAPVDEGDDGQIDDGQVPTVVDPAETPRPATPAGQPAGVTASRTTTADEAALLFTGLPRTGAGAMSVALLATALVAMGAGLMIVSRREVALVE